MNKRIGAIIVGIILLLLIVGGFIIYNKINKLREEDILYNRLYNVTKEYYKDYYYNTLGDNDEERSKNAELLKSNGIKITLNDLSKYKSNSDEILSQFKNNKTKANCDYNKTTIIIYPIEPYSKDNIRIDANIVCGI